MAARQRIERLSFTNFRGASKPVEFRFRPNQPIVLIFGENGSGKSTIADALDFLCNNDFGSLSLRKGTNPRTHIVAADGVASELAVEMEFGGNTWRARLQSGKPVTTPAGPPRAFVLRRADITRIMEATDSDRYKSLKDFITVPHIESSETALRAVTRAVGKEVEEAVQQLNIAETTLRQYWEAEGRPQRDFLSWARAAVARPLTEQQHRLESDKAILWALDNAAAARARQREAAAEWTQAQDDHTTLQAQLAAASQQQADVSLLATLQAAQSYLHNHPHADRCPICSKPEAAAVLRRQVAEQLDRLTHIQHLHQQLEQSAQTVQRAEVTQDNAQRAWQEAYALLVEQIQAGGRSRLEMAPNAAPENETVAQQSLERLLIHREKLAQRIEETQRVINQHNALATHLATIDALHLIAEEKNQLYQRLQAWLIVVEEERKRYVQETVDSISGTVSQLYARIHPDEPLGNPSFGLKPKAIGSLTLTGAFGSNHGVPPAAYYSEAHLDTLGLCVYLALARQSGNALVVLDDVLMSVDDPHLDRVIELINEEAAHFGHVIITTHSRAWFDRMRYGGGMQAELIELYGWDLHNGIRHNRAPLAVDELRATLAEPRLDRQRAASRAGVLLEQLLDTLTLQYKCRLPRSAVPRYTLGELSTGLDKKLCKLLRTEQEGKDGVVHLTDLLPLIEAATRDTWIRNQVGAHFSPDAARISDSAVRGFAASVLALADALICSHCCQLPTKNKSGSYWECGGGCGKMRLYPLVAP